LSEIRPYFDGLSMLDAFDGKFRPNGQI